MTATTKPLLTLTAADLMSTDVTAIPEQMSLRAAAHLLAQFDVSGAPVIDGQGRCIGVLSAHDFVVWAENGKGKVRADKPHGDAEHYSAWQMTDVNALPVDEVSQFMTCDPVTVPPSTSVGELSRKMRNAHIHRVIVVDGEGRPIGIVSSTDVVAAVAEDSRRATVVTNW